MLWCINTLFEHCLNNDKLILLSEESRTASFAIKTSSGTTNRETTKNIIMQGALFGSLICTAVMVKLAKVFYWSETLLYNCKSTDKITVLGMADDVLSVAKCSSASVVTNATLYLFMKINTLKLIHNKCGKYIFEQTNLSNGLYKRCMNKIWRILIWKISWGYHFQRWHIRWNH